MKIVFVRKYVPTVICLIMPYIIVGTLTAFTTKPGTQFWEAHTVIGSFLVLLALGLLIRIKRK